MNCLVCNRTAEWLYAPCTNECGLEDKCKQHPAYCDRCVPRDCEGCNIDVMDPETGDVITYNPPGYWVPCIEFFELDGQFEL